MILEIEVGVVGGKEDLVRASAELTHVPISLAVSERKKIDPEGALWNSVVTSTGQPLDMR